MLGFDFTTTSVQAKFCVWLDWFKSAACGVSCRTNTCSALFSAVPLSHAGNKRTHHRQEQIKLHLLFIEAHCVMIGVVPICFL